MEVRQHVAVTEQPSSTQEQQAHGTNVLEGKMKNAPTRVDRKSSLPNDDTPVASAPPRATAPPTTESRSLPSKGRQRPGCKGRQQCVVHSSSAQRERALPRGPHTTARMILHIKISYNPQLQHHHFTFRTLPGRPPPATARQPSPAHRQRKRSSA